MRNSGFRKILIANRGEIAVRIIRACRDLGIPAAVVYSAADRTALHVRLADEAYAIGPAPARDSYLNTERLLDAARRAGADAIHPGYGFLSESAAFASECERAGLAFIGPRSETIALMGEKTAARRAARDAGVPVVPGMLEPLRDGSELRREAERMGFPLMLKAASGGGGRGLRWVERAEDLDASLAHARGEALAAFGDGEVYLEKALTGARHVEVQIVGDHHGTVLHLFERECSVQRRHQKILEESPSVFVTPALRAALGAHAVALARSVGYRNVGTVEFLVDSQGQAYFLEMNTRIQVEHPVTEVVTRCDLVALQIRIAQGEPLPFAQHDPTQKGHAIECRVYAEDPDRGFLPSPGRLTSFEVPSGPGIRTDCGVAAGEEVSGHYDALLVKLIASGDHREQARARMKRALAEFRVGGLHTNIAFLTRLLDAPEFVRGEVDTAWVERQPVHGDDEASKWAIVAAAIQAHRTRRTCIGFVAEQEISRWRGTARREAVERRDPRRAP